MAGRIPKNFYMFSKSGNAAVHQMLVTAFSTVTDRDALCARIWEGINKISETHKEVIDTMVRERILDTVIKMTKFDPDELYPRIMFNKPRMASKIHRWSQFSREHE